MGKKSLVIVESPSKIKTLQKFLGEDFVWDSSLGHIRDLPASDFGIDIENNFTPTYEILPDKKTVTDRLIKAAKEADTVYLAPDPDREGEAIAWHIANILPEGTHIKRVSFNSITKAAVQEAIASPREIDMAMVNAQQARRLLDRIVGYKISPILNRRIQRGRDGSLSAGRVQSVALKLVVDREKEIDAFVPVEYWNLASFLKAGAEENSFRASLHSVDGKKIEKELVEGKEVFLINNQEVAESIQSRMENTEYKVTRVEKKEKRRFPVPPFITSTLQQEASRHFAFSSARTMKVAQELYEGIDMGNEGAEGLITYMRTDSVRVVPEAIEAGREWIKQQYGVEFVPAEPKEYTTKKKKNTQDAHEAIRPTNLEHPPESVRNFLSRDQFLLYSIIWKRFMASQMNPAIYDTVSADVVTTTELLLRATGSIIKFQGFLAVYEEKQDEDDKDGEGKDLPDLQEGMGLDLLKVSSDQAFTRPPPRFSEASLVKELEKSGIGRPSTYSPIMNKIQSRDYTIKEGNRLRPTELGQLIAQMLEMNFVQIMDVNFTAALEDDLEQVAEDKKDWKGLLEEFWKEFFPAVEQAEKDMSVPKIETDIDCPKCASKLQKIWYRGKYFYGCSKYPDCDYSAPIEEFEFSKDDYAEDFNWEQACPLCESEMKLRHGRYGAFLGCLKYPDCKGIVNIPKKGEIVIPPEDMPACPAIGCEGRLVARKSRFGKTFFSCSSFPDCNVIVNTFEELEKKYKEHPKTAYVKKAKKGKAGAKTKTKAKGKGKAAKKSTEPKKPRNVKPSKLSPELAAVLGADSMPRPEVMKQIWVYIKAKKLQNEQDKRMIEPDEKLAKVFGDSEPIKMFEMTKRLSAHIGKAGE